MSLSAAFFGFPFPFFALSIAFVARFTDALLFSSLALFLIFLTELTALEAERAFFRFSLLIGRRDDDRLNDLTILFRFGMDTLLGLRATLLGLLSVRLCTSVVCVAGAVAQVCSALLLFSMLSKRD